MAGAKAINNKSEISPATDNKSKALIHYVPEESGAFSDTQAKILEILQRKSSELEGSGKIEDKPLLYISLDQLADEIKNTDLSDEDKSTKEINKALLEILDIENGGKRKLAYIYPVLYLQDDVISSKIVIISPQVEKTTPIEGYRKACFNQSLTVIDKILCREIKLFENHKDHKDLDNNIYHIHPENKNKFYKPYALSMESEFYQFLKGSFHPYNLFPISDFFEDLITYGLEKNIIAEIVPKYHILKNDFKLNKKGDIKGTPLLYMHFYSQLRTLHKVITGEFSNIVNNLNLEENIALISNYTSNFDTFFNQVPDRELDRISAIRNIIEKFPTDSGLSDTQSKLIKNIKDSINILINMLSLCDVLSIEARKNLIQEGVDKFAEKATSFSREKKTMQPVRLSKLPEVEEILDKDLSRELEVEILNYIHSNFGYYEETYDDNKIYYIVDPCFLSGVIDKHAGLSKTGPIGEKQFRFVKKVRDQIVNGTLRVKIDNGYSPKELSQIKKSLSAFEEAEKQERIRREKLENFNPKAAYIWGMFSFLVLLALNQGGKSIIMLLLSLPISFGVGYACGKAFRLKKQKSVDEESSLAVKKAFKFEPPKPPNPIFKVVETILFPSGYKSIKDRIFTQKKLKKSITENLKAIKLKAGNLIKKEPDHILIEKIIQVVLDECLSVKIPDNVIPKNEPKQYIFHTQDIKDQNIKNKILGYFNKLKDLNQPPEESIQNYYNYTINAITKLF